MVGVGIGICEMRARGASGGGPDVTAPAQVSDFTLPFGYSGGEGLATWHTPGDDGATGTAARWEIRLSPSPITDGNWASATVYAAQTNLQPPGVYQELSLSIFSDAYYFAICYFDEADNRGPVSPNVWIQFE